MYKKNDTSLYISKTLGPEEQKLLWKKAQESDCCGDEHIWWEAQAEYDKQQAHINKELDIHRKERKQAIIAKLESVTPHTTPGAIESMKVAKIDLQFCWHCQIDSEVPSSKDMPRLKAEKVVVLKKAVKRYWHGETVLGESTSKADSSIGHVEEDRYSEAELY